MALLAPAAPEAAAVQVLPSGAGAPAQPCRCCGYDVLLGGANAGCGAVPPGERAARWPANTAQTKSVSRCIPHENSGWVLTPGSTRLQRMNGAKP